MSPPTPDRPPPLEGAAVAWKRSDPDSGGHFFARQAPQLGEIGAERRGERRPKLVFQWTVRLEG